MRKMTRKQKLTKSSKMSPKSPERDIDLEAIFKSGVDIVVVPSERSFASSVGGNAAAQRSLSKLRASKTSHAGMSLSG